MGHLDRSAVEKMDFASVGANVLISDKASFHGCENIRLGDNVRIDDFCLLSAGVGGITIGNYVHVAAFCLLMGRESIVLEDFCGLSSRVSIYSSSDDYLGASLTNPTIPDDFRNVKHGKVRLCKHVIVGTGAVILPDVTLAIGVAVGALSLVRADVAAFTIVAGYPARRIGERKRDLLELERQFLNSHSNLG